MPELTFQTSQISQYKRITQLKQDESVKGRLAVGTAFVKDFNPSTEEIWVIRVLK